MRIEVKFGTAKHDIEVPEDATLGALKAAIYDATNVLPPLQKLLGKPSLQAKPDDTLLSVLGIKDKTKLMLIGSVAAEVVKANAPSGAEKKKEEERERRLRNLPYSFWRLPAYGGFLADPYVAGRGAPLEGGTTLLTLLCMDVILCRLNTLGAGSRPNPSAASTRLLQALGQKGVAEVSHPFLQDISVDLRTAIQRAHGTIRSCYDFTVEASKAVQPATVLEVMDKCVQRITSLLTGEWTMIPSGWIGADSFNIMFLLIHRRAAEMFDFVVVNRGSEGQVYHPRWQTAEKILSCPILKFQDVSSTRLQDKAFWLLLLSLWMRRNDPQNQSEFIRAEVFYDVLLPWLVEKLPDGRRREDDVNANGSSLVGSLHLTTTRFTTEMIMQMPSGIAENEQQMPPWPASSTDSPFTPFIYRNAASPTCSSSSGIKSVITAFCYLLEQYYPSLTAVEKKRIKYVLKYEFFARAAEDLSRYSRRFLSDSTPAAYAANVQDASITSTPPTPSNKDTQLHAALNRLKATGINDTTTNLSLSSVWLSLRANRVYIKDKQNKILAETDFRGKIVLLFVGCLRVPSGKEVSTLLAEAVTAMKRKLAPDAVEVIFLSCDETQEEYEDHCALFDFPRSTYPCFEVIDTMELSNVPELLIFQRDGELLHRQGMSALRSDPEASQFPDGPWKGAFPLSSTDVQLLRVGASQLAHHTKKRLDRGHPPVAGSDAVLQHVLELVHAVEAVVDALPQDDVQELIQAASEVRASTTASVATATDDASTLSCPQRTVDSMVQEPIDVACEGVFQNAELLPKASVASYYGQAFQSSVPSLPEIHDLSKANNYAELYALLPRVRSVVDTLWRRAGNSGTASRVAVQLQIIEFITWTFSTLIPVPLPASYGIDAVPHEERWCVSDFYTEDVIPRAAQPTTVEGDAMSDPHAADAQLTMLECIYYLMLSLANAWQAVETPTRSFDAERCLISMEMLLVFDAVLRQVKGSNKCRIIAVLLDTGCGCGYFLSTTQGKQNIAFASMAATLQLTRPHLLPIRSAMLRYIEEQQRMRPGHELFDLRMPDKLELFKSSHTVEFLKSVLANAGYSLEQSGGLFGSGSSEMEKLMEWLCSYRSPLAKEHPAFGMLRDMTLLAKFMGTMEMRDAQLLHRRKELDALASWRISFEEDAPGRQMSAGWRTRPAPPRWECLMVRGRDMDIADIVVKGFGDREVMYGEGLALHSPLDLSRMIEVDHPTEDDVLHAKVLPTFGGTMSVEESEVLLSCLTTPYVRIPLVLDFFASQDRHTYLFVYEVQEVLRAVLFEPAAYTSPAVLRRADPRIVPMRLSKAQREMVELCRLRGDLSQQDCEDCLGTTYGLLISELTYAPTCVLRPLRSLLESITEIGPSSVYSSNASYVLFVVGLLCDVLSFCRFISHRERQRQAETSRAALAASQETGESEEAEESRRSQVVMGVIEEYHRYFLQFFVATVQPLLWAWLEESEENTDTPTQCVIHAHMSRVDRALWKGYDSLSSSVSSGADSGQHGSLQSGAGRSAPAVDAHAYLIRMLRSYAFVRARHGFGMGMQRSQLAAQEGDNLLTPEEKMLRFLQAQGLNTSRVSKELLEQGKQLMMSGGRRRAVFVQIRSRNYNDTVRVPNLIRSDPSSTTESKLLKLPPADVPENVLFCDLLEDHHLITAFLDEMTPQRRGTVLLSIVQSVLRDHTESEGGVSAPGTPEDRKRLYRRSRSTSLSTRASAANLDAMMDDGDEDRAPHGRSPQQEATTLWSVSAPGVYRGPASSGLFFHAQTCELFWRNDELKPVPDSMSHFTDFENILGKDALQCGLVSRHEHRHWVHLVGTPYDVIEWTAPPDPANQGVHHPFVISGNWPAESVESALFEDVTYDRVVAVEDDNPWPQKEERWAVDMLRGVLRAAFPSGMRFYPLAPELSPAAVSDAGNEEEVERLIVPALHHYEMRFLMNDAPQYENETERATWKEAVAYRYPQPRIEMYNLVPHARKLYRSLVFSTNQHYCLHSMALLTGARTRQSLTVTAFQAGELKRRIFNESTLEIHRYNETILGREVYIPARLLQGLIPSVLLESFFMWQGEDDVLRGYPLSEESEAASVLQDATAFGAGRRKPARGEMMDHWFNYSIEIHLHVGRRGSSTVSEAASSPATSSGCVVVRRNDKGYSAIAEAKRAASSADAAADTGRTRLTSEAQGTAHRLMLQRATSADGLTDLSTDALHASDDDESGGFPMRISDADVALLHEALSHLPKGVCVQLLRQARGDIASALTWASAAANADALLIMVERDARASGDGNGSKKRHLPQMVAKTQRAVEVCDYVLVNLLHCRNLSHLLQMLTRIEDCSHILVWGRRCTAVNKTEGDAVSADEGASHSLRVEDTTHAGRYVQIELIEMPRLRVRFYTSTDGASSRVRLFLADQPGWRLAESDDFHAARWRQLRTLQAPFQQCLLLCNSTREVAFLCPNHDFAPMTIDDDPFNPMLLFDRSSYRWREAVPSPFYVYVVHSSSSFLMPPSLSASLYYAVMQCATQHYAGAMRTLESCYTDSGFSTEEGFMFALFERTMADRFPDACAVRLKLAHAVQYSSNTYQWPLATELSYYLMVKHHVTEDCRLSRGEVLDLLKRCAQAPPMVRSQLELYAGLLTLEHQQAGESATVPVAVQTPTLVRCRFPWERLLLYPWERIAPQKLRRVSYHLQSPEMLRDERLVEFLWTDQLLMDEEGGANTKKGFYFLYCMKRNAVVPTIGEAHVGVTLSQLLARWFQLRHSRWGREAQQGGETEVAPSWCSAVLQMMEMFPHSEWPEPADNAERYILARGVSLTEEYEASEQLHGAIIGDQETTVRRRCGTIPELFNTINRVAQKHFKTDHITEAVREARQMSRLRTPENQKVTVLMRDHLRGRVVPGNTGREQVELCEPHISLDYFRDGDAKSDSAAAALRHSSLRALCTEPLSSLQLVQNVIAEGEPAAPPGSPSMALLPFDLRTHFLSRTPLGQNMLDRLEEDSMRFRTQQQAQRPQYFQCLSKDIVQEMLTTPDVAVMTALLTTAVAVLGDCVRQLHALGEQDADRVMRLRSSLLSLANDVHPGLPTNPSQHGFDPSASGAQPLDRGRLVHYLQRSERSRVAVSLEWLCAGLLSTTLESDLKAENLFHGSLQQIQAELILLMLLSNRMHFAEQAAQAVQQLLLFLELCGHLRGVVPPHAEKAPAGSDAPVQTRAARIRELVQHFSLEMDPSVLQRLTAAAADIFNEHNGIKDEEANNASDACIILSAETRRIVSGRLQQLASTAIDTLTARRTYAHIHSDFSPAALPGAGGTGGDAGSRSFRASLDPRFLVFEFLFNILLRARQVEMVEWFVRNIRQGQSRVQQMIMGQGKTTVVGPLLALILADGQQLVTQVMPTALLEQTRGILRRCFGVVVTKHIYTVQFDRSNEDGTSDGVELLYQKLKSAEEDCSVVIAAPECVKSLFLKGIEQLHMMESVPTEDMELDETADDRRAAQIQALRRKMVERSALADAITPILELWKRGVLIMDEVDVLLHPLRSELNFPIGLKYPIDMSGPRWLLPIHLLDGIFANQQGRASEDVQRQLKHGLSSHTEHSLRWADSSLAEMRDVLDEKRRHALNAIRSVILTGFRQRALQREPHLVLLDPGHYYVGHLLPALVPWLQLWLHEHLMDHLPEQERQNWAYLSLDTFIEKTKPFLLSPAKRDDADSHVSLELNAYMPQYGLQLLNLAHDWLHRLLPHVLAKIDRVSFGLLQPNDLTLSGDAARTPYSRKMTAVPFVAKDVPSRSSEFAHPDVVIGLTILAFRYEGLRVQDVKGLVTQLKQDFARQAGPKEHRPAAKLYKHWLRLSSSDRAAAAKRSEMTAAATSAAVDTKRHSTDDNEDVLRSFERAGVPLSQLHVTDKAQMQSLYHLLHCVPEVIHYYLCSTIFPRTMNFQRLKISACGLELGSSMLFRKRIGFSGTPSNILPLDLGECFYEPGSDGRVLAVLTNPEVAHAEVLPDSWTPLRLLDRIAAAQPPYSALIDAGALITNMDNEEVARYLLTRLPAALFDGVVFLDRRDRQMILQRDNGLVVPVSQCGVPLARRFTFFDQVHTTGTDVKQSSTAVAVITFGKDLVLRDYAQGAYRMRGIGKGQRLCLYLIPEVVSRIQEALGSRYRTGDMLKDVPAWLLLNSMRVEGTQFFKLSLQELANVWRKKAIAHLLHDAQYANTHAELFTGWMRCRRFQLPRPSAGTNAAGGCKHVGAEEDLSAAAAAAELSLPSADLLRASIAEFREVIEYPVAERIAQDPSFSEHLQEILHSRSQELIEGDTVSQGLVEKLLDRMRRSIQVSREAAEGAGGTSDKEASGSGATGMVQGGVHNTIGLNAEIVHEQEAEEEQEQEAEQEEQRVSAYSRDHEDQIGWAVETLQTCGTIAVDTVRPTRGCCFYQMNSFRIRPNQPQLQVSSQYLVSDNYFRLDWHGVGERRLKNVFLFLEWLPGHAASSSSATQVGASSSPPEEAPLLCSGLITLAEGESIRWLVHHSRYVQKNFRLALRFASNGAYMDATSAFSAVVHRQGVQALRHMQLSSASSSVGDDGTSACDAVADGAVLLYRFLNSDMFYTAKQLAVLEEVLVAMPPSDRLNFFTECLRVRRRSRNHWEDAPIAVLFVSEAEKPHLRQLALGKRMQQGMEDMAEVVVHAARPKTSERVRREAEPVRRSFERFTTTLSHTLSSHGASAAFSAERVAELLAEVFPAVFKSLSVQEVEQALLFLVQQKRGAAAAPAALPPSAEKANCISAEELFSVIPSLNAEVLSERVQAARAARPTAAQAQSVSITVWSCDSCTFQNPISTNVCSMCMASKPKSVREAENAEMAAAVDGAAEDADGDDDGMDAPWQCDVCTFINSSRAQVMCEICMAPNPRPLKEAGGARAGMAPFGGGFECPEGYWVCSVEHGGCSKFNPNSVFYCQVCEKARPNLASVRF